MDLGKNYGFIGLIIHMQLRWIYWVDYSYAIEVQGLVFKIN